MKKIILIAVFLSITLLGFWLYNYYVFYQKMTVKINGFDFRGLNLKLSNILKNTGEDNLNFSIKLFNNSSKKIKLKNLVFKVVDNTGNVIGKIKAIKNIEVLPNSFTVVDLELYDFDAQKVLNSLINGTLKKEYNYIMTVKIGGWFPFYYKGQLFTEI